MTGAPFTDLKTSPGLRTPEAGVPDSARSTETVVAYEMCRAVRAAAVACSCEPAICALSWACVCCAVCPGGKISVAGTTASDEFSHARSAWKMFTPVLGGGAPV